MRELLSVAPRITSRVHELLHVNIRPPSLPQVWDLIPGGRDVVVTNTSVISYIHLMAHFKLNVQTARPCKAFLQGFRYFQAPLCFVRGLFVAASFSCTAPHGAPRKHDTASISCLRYCSDGGRSKSLSTAALFFLASDLRPYASQHVRPFLALDFVRGLFCENRDLIPVEWIRLFNPQELQRLIGGEGGRAVDVDDLKRNTLYAGGYHESQPVMKVPSRHPL